MKIIKILSLLIVIHLNFNCASFWNCDPSELHDCKYASDLYKSWGNPKKVYHREDGGKVLVYYKNFNNEGETKIKVFTDKEGRIYNWNIFRLQEKTFSIK